VGARVTAGEPDPVRGKAAALKLDLPAATGRAGSANGSAPLRWGASVRGILAGAVGAVVLLAAAAWVAAPWLLRRQCIEDAALHGIALTVDSVTVHLGGFALLDVQATAGELRGVHFAAPEVDVLVSALRPQKLNVTGAEVTVDGTFSAARAAFARWRASESGGEGGAWAPASLVVDGSRIVWKGLAGPGPVQAAGVHVEVSWQGAGPTIHASSDLVTVTVPSGSLGPWRVDCDRAPGSLRLRVALDPGVPDSSSILVLGDDAGVVSVDAVIHRSPITRLGIPPKVLGLSGKALQVEANVHYATLGPRAAARASGGIYGAQVVGVPWPMDVVWKGAAIGDSGASLDVKQARLAVGPLGGSVRGTLRPYEDGFRLDLGWDAGPVPCASFDAPPPEGQELDMGYQLRKLAEGIGIAKVSGNVSAHATLAFDSRDLTTAAVSFTHEASCKVALFGSL
ncbi:MAG: hypothetical protein ACREJ3_05650, partial [Polyangiaceae bacterium]